ncbi:MAG: hypothetical protein HY015_05390 [Bacteroidetes bacterium]|nr:hypothetical protein [Bacteroidota bacterium]MBI3482394.1 hypothetical protein [Bacteroidota bacterium]
METEKIIFLRDFLVKTFIVGLAFAIFIGIVTFLLWDSWMMHRIERAFALGDGEMGEIVLTFFSIVRIVLLFFFLAPCIALHWMIKTRK